MGLECRQAYLEHTRSRPRERTRSRSKVSTIRTSRRRPRSRFGVLSTGGPWSGGRRRRSPGSRGSGAVRSGRGAVVRTAPTASRFYRRRSFQTRHGASLGLALDHCSPPRTSLADSTRPALRMHIYIYTTTTPV